MDRRLRRIAVAAMGAAVALSVVACSDSDTAQEDRAATAPQAGSTPTSAVTTLEPPPACPLTNDEIVAITAERLHVTSTTSRGVNTPGPSDAADCRYSLSTDSVLDIVTHRYSENNQSHVGVYDRGGDYGGTTPQAVFVSASNAYRSVDPSDTVVRPSGEGGIVVSGSTGVVAKVGDFWYWISFSGSSTNAAFYEPMITSIASKLS